MFGLIDSDRSDEATGRFVRALSGRHFRGFGQDYGPLIAAGIQLTATAIGAGIQVYQADQRAAQQQQAADACAQYGAGYVFNPATGQCMAPQPQPGAGGAGSFLSNIDPVTVAVGVGVLVLLFTMNSGKGS